MYDVGWNMNTGSSPDIMFGTIQYKTGFTFDNVEGLMVFGMIMDSHEL